MRNSESDLRGGCPRRAGFSLVEVMIALTLLAIVAAVVLTVLIGSQRSKADTDSRLEAQQGARAISDIIAQDLRTAGYQADTDANPDQPAIAYVDSTEIIFCSNLGPFPDTTLAAGVPAPGNPQAYNPAGVPKPYHLNGTAYAPPVKYGTGAELIRYSLDLTNDGAVDASDQAAALAGEAVRTQNPNDYVLARAVYGDNSGGVALNNGGSLEKVGLVTKPGGGVPPLFEVYLGASATPWDWANGAVPAASLSLISRVVLRITTESRRPARDGQYTRQTLTTEINSIRNVPTAGTTLYAATGYVFNDLNRNGTKDVGESGLPNVAVRLGTVSVSQTSSTGFYSAQGPPAAYVLKQDVPGGFGAFTPDSFVVNWLTSPGDVTHDFADSARTGGWLIDTSYVDTNNNNQKDPADELADRVTLTASGESDISDANGAMAVFLPPGTHTVTYVAPESMTVVTPNPASVVITNGVNTIHYTKLSRSGFGTINGAVYRDFNKNRVKDAGETGISGVWVGVTRSAGAVTVVYTTTDSSGNYTLLPPNNMPEAVTPYEITCIPPDGFFPTGSTQLSPIWVTTGQVINSQDFGMSTFSVISLTADRVLALSSGNLLEKDWTGSDGLWASKGSNDIDLILGSEYVSNPNVSVWFNQYGSTPMFPATVSYQRNAGSSALSVAVGPIDATVPTIREDVITGLARKPGGNIAVWLTQNSSGNLGFLPVSPTLYQTSDAGDANVVVLADVGGTSALDAIVGTTGLANRGVVETWINSGTGTFARDEIYPTNGSIPGGILGEIKAIAFADVNRDGNADMILGMKTGSGQGKVVVLRYVSRTAGNRYVFSRAFDVTGEVTSLAMTYVDSDTDIDLVVGTRVSSTTGNIQYWRGTGSSDFNLTRTFTAIGPVLSLIAADMGGSTKKDLVFGFRTDESVYTGGTRILYLDLNALPPDDVDPAGGTQSWMAASINANHLNYRINNVSGDQTEIDLAIAAKTGATTGSLIIFTR